MGPMSNIGFRIKTKLLSFYKSPIYDYKKIPIVLNNFNRLEYLKLLVDWLEKSGYSNIHIIDNNSTYKPLLDYYRLIPYTVYKLDRNIGFLALWKTIVFTRFSDDYYVYSDADILPCNNCPSDFLAYFKDVLDKHNLFDKVGFGLEISDLPNHYPLKEKVIQWESQYWKNKIDTNLYEAPIDTTFALYRPRVKGGSELNAIRTGEPYIAKHLPWYINPDSLAEDESYYQNTASSSSSWTYKFLGKQTISKY